MSMARVLNGKIGDGTTFLRPSARRGRVAGGVQAHGPEHREARPRRRRRDGRARQARSCQYRRHPHRRQAGASAACHGRAPMRRCWRSRSPPRSARTTSSWARRCTKLLEEDPSITVVHNAEAHEVVLWGQGEMQLRVATERLADRFGVATSLAQADGGLSRDHQEGHRAARPPQEAVGRSRPIRRCRTRHQAVAARLGLHLHRGDQGRRRAAQLHPLGGGGRRSTRSSTGRSAFRWSTSRRS